ncbi:hypothetical protein VX037_03640, partial [Gordonia sp. Z-3]|uniref:hypothetical protein n=1 Tax=Gordonia sp. Z-3 TaxID=3115408 RepID=UPI002E2A6543
PSRYDNGTGVTGDAGGRSGFPTVPSSAFAPVRAYPVRYIVIISACWQPRYSNSRSKSSELSKIVESAGDGQVSAISVPV